MSAKCVNLLGKPTWDRYLLKTVPRGGTDWFKADEKQTWHEYAQHGGVAMLRDMLEELGVEVRLVAPAASEHLHALAEINAVDTEGGVFRRPRTNDGSERPGTASLRIASYEGYLRAPLPVALKGTDIRACSTPCVTVINDDGTIVDFHIPEIIALLKFGDGVPRVHKIVGSLTQRDHWYALHGDHTIVVVSAHDLRQSGTRLSRSLSWERALEELRHAYTQGDGLLCRLVDQNKALVVVFDVEGAAILRGSEGQLERLDLVFDPTRIEGSTALEKPGDMTGKLNAFTAGLTTALVEKPTPTEQTKAAVKAGLETARRLASGYISVESGGSQIALPKLGGDDTDSPYNSPEELNFDSKEISFLSKEGLLEKARDAVIKGLDALGSIPSLTVGKLTTVDRHEIEGFRSVRRLIAAYLQHPSPERPLSILVLGPPGAGKSFGLKQIAKELKVETITANMTELGEKGLPGVFHDIRSRVLEGKQTLCFFDEFDARERRLIASFLAPMQDGAFREGAVVHPIGRAIFVFIGSTATTFASFEADALKELDTGESGKDRPRLKLNDFVSRLSGYVDIKGPNADDPQASSGCESAPKIENTSAVLRRAVLLRSFLARHAPSIFDGNPKANGKLKAEPGLIDAFLTIQYFKHGARSMERIIEASAIDSRTDRYTASDLPPADQLELHVDAAAFERILRENAGKQGGRNGAE